MAAPVRDAGSALLVAAAGASKPMAAECGCFWVLVWQRDCICMGSRPLARPCGRGSGTCSRAHDMFDEMKSPSQQPHQH